ncbi:MAG: carbonic anhydrase [Candidatus Eremiobacteraeota bacterium]|nr:carbonic anhydrase [Candidatus Eremiobacteraeota bacterium]
MAVTNRYLEHNEHYVSNGGHGALPMPPSQHLAVVACMDARLDVYKILGLAEGEAHVIRNAGGVVTEDALRSLIISQRLLGTVEVVLIHHTDCGMLTFKDDELRAKIAAEVGEKPLFALQAFSDLEEDVREGLLRVRGNPFLPHREAVRGFIFDVETGKLREVSV